MEWPSEFRQIFDDKNLPAETAQMREWTHAQGLSGTVEYLKTRGIGKQEAWKFVRIYLTQSFREFTTAWNGSPSSS